MLLISGDARYRKRQPQASGDSPKHPGDGACDAQAYQVISVENDHSAPHDLNPSDRRV
jgi:hypothetical protein